MPRILESPFDPKELLEMLADGRLREKAKQGYVAQAGSDGKMRWVHWTESSSLGFGKGVKRRRFAVQPDYKEDELTPIVKRSGQERVRSLVEKLVTDWQRTGTVPGLDNELIKDIVSESWKEGDPLTMQQVQRIAQRFLEDAEVERRKYLHKNPYPKKDT